MGLSLNWHEILQADVIQYQNLSHRITVMAINQINISYFFKINIASVTTMLNAVVLVDNIDKKNYNFTFIDATNLY